MANSAGSDLLGFISSVAREGNDCIRSYRLDESSGALEHLSETTEVERPFFIAGDPRKQFLYSVVFDGEGSDGAVRAFSIDRGTGRLSPLNQHSAKGAGTCYICVDRTRQVVLVANYVGGSVAALPIRDDGSVGEATSFIQHEGSSVHKRQKEPHAHCITIDPGNQYAFAADLGLDKILIYRLDAANGKLIPNDPPFVKTHPGAGPRHFTFHPTARFAYAINELDNTMTAFAYDPLSGTLTQVQVITTVPDDFDGTTYCADVKVAPSGNFLYGTNRGHQSIAVYAIDPETGRLSLVEIKPSGGDFPQNIAITPSGRILIVANQESDRVVNFQIDDRTGRLTPTGHETEIPKPCCICLVRP